MTPSKHTHRPCSTATGQDAQAAKRRSLSRRRRRRRLGRPAKGDYEPSARLLRHPAKPGHNRLPGTSRRSCRRRGPTRGRRAGSCSRADEVISVEELVSDADLSATCSSTWKRRDHPHSRRQKRTLDDVDESTFEPGKRRSSRASSSRTRASHCPRPTMPTSPSSR